MHKLLITVVISAFGASAQAATIDSFSLDMNAGSGGGGLTGVNSTAVLANGVNYLVNVSGTFEIGCISGGCPTDAEYYWPSAAPYNDATPFDLTGFDSPGGLDIGVKLDNLKVSWGAANPAHEYSYVFTGTGSTLFVNYQDSNYGDNSGSLEITISTIDIGVIPVPAGLPLALTGLGMFVCLRRRPARQRA